MRYVRLPTPVLRMISPVMRWWWRIRRPTTFGVKALLLHPDEPGQFLTVRHSYVDTRRWGLPGGGFRPRRETPQEAAAREVAEELGIELPASSFTILDTVTTTLEAKRDTLTILVASSPTPSLSCSPELTEARWVSNLAELGEAPVSKWLRLALRLADEPSGPI